jgi:hypothetical protein
LKRQVAEVRTLMKVSDTVAQFKRLFAKRFGGQIHMDL